MDLFWFINSFWVSIHKQLSRCNLPCIWIFKFIRTQINHGSRRPFKSSIIWFDDVIRSFEFNPNSVYIYLPKIISYLPLAESSTWHFHATIFFALSSGKVKSISTLILVVILPDCMCHYSIAYFLGTDLFTSLTITTVKLYPIYNRIRKFINFALPFLVFIHPCRIGEEWLFLFFAFRRIEYII